MKKWRRIGGGPRGFIRLCADDDDGGIEAGKREEKHKEKFGIGLLNHTIKREGIFVSSINNKWTDSFGV